METIFFNGTQKHANTPPCTNPCNQRNSQNQFLTRPRKEQSENRDEKWKQTQKIKWLSSKFMCKGQHFLLNFKRALLFITISDKHEKKYRYSPTFLKLYYSRVKGIDIFGLTALTESIKTDILSWRFFASIRLLLPPP